MAVLDTTIVNVALDTLSSDLHAPLRTIQWVSTAYLLSLAAVNPAVGLCPSETTCNTDSGRAERRYEAGVPSASRNVRPDGVPRARTDRGFRAVTAARR